jgi:hypothetical protein
MPMYRPRYHPVRFAEYTGYDRVALARKDARWRLDDLRVSAKLGKPVRRRVRVNQKGPAADASLGINALLYSEYSPEVVEALWTSAQVASISLALGSYLSSTARKWRDKKTELPEGTRLTLTLTPAKGDRRRATRIVISDIHTKTPDEITNEIRQTLMRYVREPRDAGRRTEESGS